MVALLSILNIAGLLKLGVITQQLGKSRNIIFLSSLSNSGTDYNYALRSAPCRSNIQPGYSGAN